MGKAKPLVLHIDQSGEYCYMETAGGERLPGVHRVDLPPRFPHKYDDDWPMVTVSFILQDVRIVTRDFERTSAAPTVPQPAPVRRDAPPKPPADVRPSTGSRGLLRNFFAYFKA